MKKVKVLLILTENIHNLLIKEKEKTGKSIVQLIRDAIVDKYEKGEE